MFKRCVQWVSSVCWFSGYNILIEYDMWDSLIRCRLLGVFRLNAWLARLHLVIVNGGVGCSG